MKPTKSLVASLVFLVILLGIYIAHVAFFRVNVVLYSSILDGCLAVTITGGLLFGLKYFNVLNTFEKLQLTVIWLLASYAFAISVPTVIDRSLSFYILEKIQQRGGGIKYAQFNDVFTKEYVKEHRLVDARLTEQLESGTITIVNGCVKITDRGERLAAFSRFFRKNFLPKQRLLMGEYSKDLTDPFKNSVKAADYECQ
ncbi:MAG: hypothetical protein Q7S71_05580 [Candidatus Nitrotoga sp.]|nr:hypothetical protein [Candidatus Nitrotoga sp.]